MPSGNCPGCGGYVPADPDTGRIPHHKFPNEESGLHQTGCPGSGKEPLTFLSTKQEREDALANAKRYQDEGVALNREGRRSLNPDMRMEGGKLVGRARTLRSTVRDLPWKTPRLLRGYEGCYVKSLTPIENGLAVAPPGTVYLVEFSGVKAHLKAIPCHCCGIEFKVTLSGRDKFRNYTFLGPHWGEMFLDESV